MNYIAGVVVVVVVVAIVNIRGFVIVAANHVDCIIRGIFATGSRSILKKSFGIITGLILSRFLDSSDGSGETIGGL